MSEESVAAVREAAEGLTRGISREYWLQCAKEKKFPQKLWDAMAETGLLGLTVPEEYGGSGGGLSELMVLNEVTGRAGIISLFFVLGSFARMPIIKHGTPEQITKFVTPTATGEGKMCFGVTEPLGLPFGFGFSASSPPLRHFRDHPPTKCSDDRPNSRARSIAVSPARWRWTTSVLISNEYCCLVGFSTRHSLPCSLNRRQSIRAAYVETPRAVAAAR